MTNIRMDNNARQIVREVFNVNPKDIFDLTNEIIKQYEQEKLEGKKKLLLIFNELDHMRNAEKVTQLFVDNKYYLENLSCRKVISVPLVLMTFDQFKPTREVSHEYIDLKLSPNPIKGAASMADQALIEDNRALLRQIVQKRIATGAELIDDDALETAIDQSGGIIRQFVIILSYAARRARKQNSSLITQSDIEYGVGKARQEVEASLIGQERIALLAEVQQTNTPSPENAQLLIQCLQSNQILAHRNAPNWYALNPLIEDTVRIYAETLQKEKDATESS